MATQPLQLPLASSPLSTKPYVFTHHSRSQHLSTSLVFNHHRYHNYLQLRRTTHCTHVGIEDIELPFGANDINEVAAEEDEEEEEEEEEEEVEPTPEDLEYISEIKRVLELLRKNRDMLYGEVKLTISIEDPRELERRRLVGIDDSDGPSREDLAACLEEVNEGKIPRDRIALQILAEEMKSWPNLEVEPTKTKGKNKSLYAKATDTGIDPKLAAKKLNVDWDSAAEIEEGDTTNDTDVPAAVGFGALYIVTAFPVIIGVSVVLILFYNSLQ